ncbi:MAG: ABC transporter ATP-binding protein [Clostridia bacterium]|nr:ABC transporter ATP-binding protein [Clostridia bacterium]
MHIGICDIKKKYGRKVVLDGVSFEAESGSVIGVIGVNGSGKSTLLGILSGVLRATSGDFTVDGESVFKNGSLRDKIGFVPQGTPLIEELTARDNLLLWYSKEQMEAELERGVLKILGIDGFLNVRVSRMSGGMKKRLSIGCAVASGPEVILLDEPTSALDIVCREAIADYLRKFRAAGGIIIIATHDVKEIDLCDKIYILKDGHLSDVGSKRSAEELTEILVG